MKRSIHNLALAYGRTVAFTMMSHSIPRKLRALASIGLATVIQGLLCTVASAVPTFTFDHSSLHQTVAPAADGFRYYQTQLLSSLNGSGVGTNLGTLPSYVSSITTAGDAFYSGGSSSNAPEIPVNSTTGFYADLVIQGTGYRTGIGYKVGAGTQTLATITLGGTVPATFQLGVYTQNTDDFRNQSTGITLTSGANSITHNYSVEPVAFQGTGDFYFFNVVGATSGETITLGMSGTGAIPLGGLTFFTPIPEPASTTLFGAGAFGLMATYRRRRSSIRST